MTEQNEAPLLHAYWCASLSGKGHNQQRGARFTNAEAKLLVPWMEVPSGIKSIHPEPRYYRNISHQDQANIQYMIGGGGSTRSTGATTTTASVVGPAFKALEAISHKLRPYGSFSKSSYTNTTSEKNIASSSSSEVKKANAKKKGKGKVVLKKGSMPSPLVVGHVWITMPILTTMSQEVTTLVECANRERKGPLYDAIEALRESMLTMDGRACINVAIINHNELKKLEPAASSIWDELSTPSTCNTAPIQFDCETNSFVRISCKSGSHTQSGAAQEAAAFAVLRLVAEIFLQGMVAAAFEKPLALNTNETTAHHRGVADDVQRQERKRYLETVVRSEKNFTSAENMWRSEAGKKKIVAALKGHTLSQTTPLLGSKRDRGVEAPAIVNAVMSSTPVSASKSVSKENSSATRAVLGDRPNVVPNSTTSTLPSQVVSMPPPYSKPSPPPSVFNKASHNSAPAVHQNPSPPGEQPSVSLGRRVEQTEPIPVAKVPQPPPQALRPLSHPSKSSDIGNNCDFVLPENGFVSPRHCLNAFDQIAGLSTSQRNALVVSLHGRMKTAVTLWPKSMEELRSVDAFHLLRNVVDALGGYGKLEFEAIEDGDDGDGLVLPSFSGMVSAPPPEPKYRATISVIFIAPANVFAYGPPQHALLMEMLRQEKGVDKTRVQEPLSQLVSSSGSEAVESMDEARRLASVAMIDAISPLLVSMHSYFRKHGAALGCTSSS